LTVTDLVPKTASAIKYIGNKTVSLNVAAFTPPYVGHGQVGSRFGPPKNFGVTPPMFDAVLLGLRHRGLNTGWYR